jgi:hypothetical protein
MDDPLPAGLPKNRLFETVGRGPDGIPEGGDVAEFMAQQEGKPRQRQRFMLRVPPSIFCGR